MILIRKLDNGIMVALEEIPYVRSIAFGIWVKNGSRNERPEENGISHYIEHMLFKGTQSRTAKQIAEEMDKLGGQVNAYTTKDHTCFHTRVLDKHFEHAVDVMSDMLFHSLFAEADVDKERNVIVEEIYMYEDAPEELVHDALQDSVWQGGSLGMPILGTEETISNITSEALRAYWKENYHTDNIVLSVAGNFKAENMLEVLNRVFGQVKRHTPYTPFQSQAAYMRANVIREKDVEQVHTCIAFPSLSRGHELRYALSVFNTIFGGGMSSRLFQKIREEHGLTYSIYSYITTFADAGLFSVYAGMNPSQMEQVFSLIAGEIADAKENGISEELLAVTKEQMISGFVMGTESTLNRMTASGASLLLNGYVQTMEDVINEIEKVSADDVMQVIHMIFDMSQMSFSAVGNVKGYDICDMVKKVFS